jgi:hypothetical protein
MSLSEPQHDQSDTARPTDPRISSKTPNLALLPPEILHIIARDHYFPLYSLIVRRIDRPAPLSQDQQKPNESSEEDGLVALSWRPSPGPSALILVCRRIYSHTIQPLHQVANRIFDETRDQGFSFFDADLSSQKSLATRIQHIRIFSMLRLNRICQATPLQQAIISKSLRAVTANLSLVKTFWEGRNSRLIESPHLTWGEHVRFCLLPDVETASRVPPLPADMAVAVNEFWKSCILPWPRQLFTERWFELRVSVTVTIQRSKAVSFSATFPVGNLCSLRKGWTWDDSTTGRRLVATCGCMIVEGVKVQSMTCEEKNK